MLGYGLTISDVTDDLVGFFRDPAILTGIPLALLGAVFMSLGAQYQHRGVAKVERLSEHASSSGLTGGQLLSLLKRPSWVLGTIMLALAILCQLGALAVAPLILVQPLGAIALVITTLLNARVSGNKPTRQSIIAIVACVGGIFLFVTIAAFFAEEHPITELQLIIILAILAVVIVVFAVLWFWLRTRMQALFYIMAAGVIYGFVATLAKVVIKRIQDGDFEWLTLVCLVALLAAVAMGAYFVQTAYSAGPPDLVIAGLTVVDPIVAVFIGLLVLGEASGAPWWAFVGFGIAGAIAVWGVVQLARFHPEVVSGHSKEVPIERGSDGGENRAPSTGSIRITDAVSKVWPAPPIDESDGPLRLRKPDPK
ncbi:DMT family transporter [Microbacterium sp. P01]|uniref:DMT family transporter n=1 Tax=unclassified Microbacterium TaxID=2609290 RepID=UPI00366ADF56